MNEPIRVLHVFAALDSGGVANFVMNTYRCIDRNKIQYDFALTGGEKSFMDDEAVSFGARLFYFGDGKSIEENLRAVLINEGPFEAIHSHVFFYSGLVLREARKCGVPVRIAHAHNAHTGESSSITRKAYEATMRYLINANATVMLGCSEKACRYVFGNSSMGDSRTAVLPDGIDCDRFAFDEETRKKVRSEYGLEDRFVVGHVGHLNPAKNHEKIISVFAEFAKQRADAALMLVGDGELESKVRTKVSELFLDDKVVFAGAHTDVERMYQAMDVFIFPSRYEGFGMAMIEAQASGLACVASDVVPEDTNADGRAVYLPLSEPDEVWAAALLAAPERSTGSANKVRQAFGIEATVDKLGKIYLRK